MRRPDDLLVCTLRFTGFAFLRDPPRLDRAAPDAFITIEFPPQSFGEEAFLLRFTGFAFLRDPPRLDRAAPDAFITIEFPPQSFGEEAFLLVQGQGDPSTSGQNLEVTLDKDYPPRNVAGTDELVPATLPIARIRIAGPSRVVVAMPQEQESVAFDLENVLGALHEWPMRLAPVAVPDGSKLGPSGTGVAPPATNITSLELPYRLLLSPLNPATWRYSIDPVSHDGRTELWHARLGNAGDPGDADGVELPSRVRAIWSPDYRPPAQLDELYKLIGVPGPPGQRPLPNPALIRMSLDPVDRAMLVTLMSGFGAAGESGSPYLPLSAQAKRLHLTALGGLLDTEGSWTALPEGIDLEQWRHEATLGRDHYVRVVYAGYLCPFGHAASLVKVTERRFQPLGSATWQRIAVLRQRFFIVVREPVRSYTGANHPYAGRNFPFTRVEVLTRVTPDLLEPGSPPTKLAPLPSGVGLYATIASRMLFWPMIPGSDPTDIADMQFHIAATDIAGNRVTFAMPLLFVGKPANEQARAQTAIPNTTPDLLAAYNATHPNFRRKTVLDGASITFAPPDPSSAGDPTLPATDMTFRAGNVVAPADPDFYPEVDRATVGIKPVQKLLAQPCFTTEVAYPDVYARNGFNAAVNAGQVFLQLTRALPLEFGGKQGQAKSDALGALATPQVNVLGLSRIMGPVAGQDVGDPAAVASALTTITGGTFNPQDFFRDAMLLGGIKLGDVVQAAQSLGGDDVPKLLSRDFPDRVEASFEWNGRFNQNGSPLLIPNADRNEAETRLLMSGLIRTPLDPAQAPSFHATSVLNNFKLNLFGFIILWFESLTFDARSGQKPDVSVRMRQGEDAVTFGGPLQFVNTLRHYIPSNGFSDPPGLTVTPSGIGASYSLNLPAIEVGVFAMSNVALGASFSLPFDGTPALVKFAFSSREHPFSLTVSLLGGGGFFGIGITSEGIREIEAALEFGAVVAIDLGVASGSVEVKAGIYFHWLEPPSGEDSVELAGYVRIHGELCVLALISVALTFNLQLSYQNENGRSIVSGEATLTVEIDILMFSTSVPVKCRREFGGGGDPKFIEQIPTQEVWSKYCDAFTIEAA